MLGNTPAICRKCYIHPAIFDGYLDGSLLEALKQRTEEKLADPGHGLRAEEAAVVGFLASQFKGTSIDTKIDLHDPAMSKLTRRAGKPISRPPL
jgi:DNA topoisomerase-1